MAQPRCWGDELTLRAAAEAYGVTVHVVTTEKEHWLLHYNDDDAPPPGPAPDGAAASAAAAARREAFLAYVSPIHYNVVVPRVGLEDVGSGY